MADCNSGARTSWPRTTSFVITMSFDRKAISPESTNYHACSSKIFFISAAIFVYKRLLPIPSLRSCIKHCVIKRALETYGTKQQHCHLQNGTKRYRPAFTGVPARSWLTFVHRARHLHLPKLRNEAACAKAPMLLLVPTPPLSRRMKPHLR